MMLCHCEGVNDRTVRSIVAEGATDVEDVIQRCGAGGGCRGCWPELRKLIDEGRLCATISTHAG
jgi:bacterioferritin-associated ferredoxin